MTLSELEKLDWMFEHTNGYSGCENTVYRASFHDDEFVNCKSCACATGKGSQNPCILCRGNFIQLDSGKYVGANFVMMTK